LEVVGVGVGVGGTAGTVVAASRLTQAAFKSVNAAAILVGGGFGGQMPAAIALAALPIEMLFDEFAAKTLAK